MTLASVPSPAHTTRDVARRKRRRAAVAGTVAVIGFLPGASIFGDSGADTSTAAAPAGAVAVSTAASPRIEAAVHSGDSSAQPVRAVAAAQR